VADLHVSLAGNSGVGHDDLVFGQALPGELCGLWQFFF